MIFHKYDPRLKTYKELAATFACGENVLKELLNELKPDDNKKTSKQSWIITGPRGAGKSHLLALLYKKITADRSLSACWYPIMFPEELFDVDSLYRLLLKIFEYIFKNADSPRKLEKIRAEFSQLKKAKITGNLRQKKEKRHRISKNLFELLVEVRKVTGKKLILMLENLQNVFKNQLSEDDLKHLRGFMNENPDVFIIIGTALGVFREIENYETPFYHFFRIRSFDSLDEEDTIAFLSTIASFRNHMDINAKIENNLHFIYIFRLITAGNPRWILFLYELLMNNDSLNSDIILEKIMEMTPYFLNKTLGKSMQKKLILNTLATEAPAMTATEIAELINEEQKSVIEQLKRLAAEDWIKEVPIRAKKVKPKEVFYAFRDYVYRVWYNIRTKGRTKSDIYYLLKLAVMTAARKQLEEPVEYPDMVGEKPLVYGEETGQEIAEKRNVLLKTIGEIIEQPYNEGIEIPDIIIKIIHAVENPDTREAQTWMADPLFAEIVSVLSE